MSLRLKIVAALVLLASCATAAVGVSSYVSTQRELNQVIDRSLTSAASNPRQVQNVLLSPRFGIRPGQVVDQDADGDNGGGPLSPPPRALDALLAQLIDADGVVQLAPSSGKLPVDDADRAVANGTNTDTPSPRDVTIDGEPFRMLTIHVSTPVGDGAIQIARSAR